MSYSPFRLVRAALLFLSLALPVLAEAGSRPANFRPDDYRILPTKDEKLEGMVTPKSGYPMEFRRRYKQVSAAIRVFVNENGGIDEAGVAAAAGDLGLANFAAQHAKANWKFPRRTVGGKPVKYQWIVPVTYAYDGGEKKLNEAIRALNNPLIKPFTPYFR